MTNDTIRVQRWKKIIVDGVIADGNSEQAFIRVDGCTDFTISNFHWIGITVAQGIQITRANRVDYPMKNWTVGPRSISGSLSHSILGFQAEGGVILGVSVENVGSNGIGLDGCGDIVITNPIVADVGITSNGVRIFNGSKRCRVDGSVVSGVFSNAIVVDGASEDCTINNF